MTSRAALLSAATCRRCAAGQLSHSSSSPIRRFSVLFAIAGLLAPAPSLAEHRLGWPIEIVLTVDLTGAPDDVAARAARMAEVIVKATEMALEPVGSPMAAPRFAAIGFDSVGATPLWDFAEWDVSGPRSVVTVYAGAFCVPPFSVIDEEKKKNLYKSYGY